MLLAANALELIANTLQIIIAAEAYLPRKYSVDLPLASDWWAIKHLIKPMSGDNSFYAEFNFIRDNNLCRQVRRCSGRKRENKNSPNWFLHLNP